MFRDRVAAATMSMDRRWDIPAADFGERITTVEPESRVRLIPSAPSGVAIIKHI
jgi:hypothetical protein